MYEEKIKTLREKLSNIKENFSSLSEEERFIIEKDSEIKEIFINEVLKNIEFFSINDLENFQSEIQNRIQTEDTKTLVKKNIYKLLQEEIATDSDIEEIYEFGFTEDEYNFFIDERNRILSDLSKTDFYVKGTDDTINLLIDKNRLDLVFKALNCDHLSESTIKRIKDVWPSDKYYPDFMINYVDINSDEINRISQDALIKELRYRADIIDEPKYNVKLQNLADIIYKKYKNNEHITKINETYSLKNLADVINNNEHNEELYQYFLNDKWYYLLPYLEISNEIKKKYMIKFLDEDKEIIEKQFKNIFKEKILDNYKDDGIALGLIKTGKIFEIEELDEDFIEKYENIIYELIKNDKIKTDKIYFPAQISDRINKLLIEKGCIETCAIKNQNISEEELITLNQLLELNKNINFKSHTFAFGKINDSIKNVLVKNKCIKGIVSIYDNKCIVDITKENKELIDIIKNDYLLIKNLLSRGILDYCKNGELIKELAKDPFITKLIIDKINHEEKLIEYYNDDFFDIIKESLSIKYKIDLDKLTKIEKVTGPYIIRYLENTNVKEIFNLNDKDLDRFLSLFKQRDFNFENLKNTYDSIKQQEFSKKYPDEVNIFNILKHAIEDNDNEKINFTIDKISKEINSETLKSILKELKIDNLNESKADTYFLLQYLVSKIKQDESANICLDIIHEITKKYIEIQREKYRETYNMNEDLQLKYYIEDKVKKDYSVKKALACAKSNIIKGEKDIYINYLIEVLQPFNISKELIEEALNQYLNGITSTKYDKATINKTIGKLVKETNKLLEQDMFDIYFDQFIRYEDEKNNLPRKYYMDKKPFNPFEIISNMNIKLFTKEVIENDEIYASLLKTMNKRKIHIMPDNIENILKSKYINIDYSNESLGSFLTYYASIYSEEKRRLESANENTDNIILKITDILTNADIYSSVASVYSMVLGNEDLKLIRKNPGPNAANRITKEERLEKAIQYTKRCFERTEITIPPFIEDFTFNSPNNGDKKTMRVTVGDLIDPSNLTHGERTGACMRIGGVGGSLFDFCLTNPNGFHIKFTDPSTDEYISRVSGFRNGNTIFLNELRCTCNKEKYSDQDIVKACKLAAQKLIEESKNSKMPIDNVVIHRAYATDSMEKEITDLQVKSVKEGLPIFYSDVNNHAIILATSNNDKLVPINFDKTNVPVYKPLRKQPVEYEITPETYVKVVEGINRISSVKAILENKNKDFISAVNMEDGITHAILNSDWYIYVDRNGRIHNDAITKDERAVEEMNAKLFELQEKLDKKETINIGGKNVSESRKNN